MHGGGGISVATLIIGSPRPSTKIEPVLKWPGGKSLLLPSLLSAIPQAKGRFFEPFLGSAAVFLGLNPPSAVLGDVNKELINFYTVLRDSPVDLYRAISRLRNTHEEYYALRSAKPRAALTRATRLFFLNKTCFNGLYRTNRNGEFNVPFGDNGRQILPAEKRFLVVSQALKAATLVTTDFETTCKSAISGDVVYFDPPYTVAHNNNGFIKYNARLFSWQDQLRLKALVDCLVSRGVTVVLTNADHHSIRALYDRYVIRRLERHSVLSGSAKGRKRVSELLISAS